MDSNKSIKFCACCSVSEVEEFVTSVCDQCEYLLLLTSLQCGNTLQDEKLAVMQNLPFENTAVDFWHTRKQTGTFSFWSLVHWGDAFPFQFWIWSDLIKAGSACSKVKPFFTSTTFKLFIPFVPVVQNWLWNCHWELLKTRLKPTCSIFGNVTRIADILM